VNPDLDVVVLGGAAVDWVAEVETLPPRDGLALAHSYRCYPGGSAANVAVGLARLGFRTGFVGKLGDDENGQFLRQAFDTEGVDTTALRVAPGQPTATCFVGLDAQGDRMVFSLPGASLLEEPAELDLWYVGQGRVLYIGPAYTAVAVAASAAAHAAGALVIYAPSGAWGRDGLAGLRPILKGADLLLVSQPEAMALSGQATPQAALGTLVETGVAAVVETLGAQGVLVHSGGDTHHLTSFPVSPQDTTGAGDAFAAGLIAGYLEGRDWLAAAQLGNAVAALKIQQMGARNGLPSREQVSVFMSDHGMWREG
jgi:ribokinase